jgi:hypothetical protein
MASSDHLPVATPSASSVRALSKQDGKFEAPSAQKMKLVVRPADEVTIDFNNMPGIFLDHAGIANPFHF